MGKKCAAPEASRVLQRDAAGIWRVCSLTWDCGVDGEYVQLFMLVNKDVS